MAQVVDDQDAVLPVGNAGQLRLRSAGIIDQYIDDPAETARSFRNSWFYPRDSAEFTPRGTLIHHGRADDLIIFDGINIHPTEIENVLLKHPAVVEAAALPVQTTARGNVPFAAVVLRSPASESDLLSHCNSWLGLRSPVGVRQVEKLPRNAIGKVLKRDLASMCRERHRPNRP